MRHLHSDPTAFVRLVDAAMFGDVGRHGDLPRNVARLSQFFTSDRQERASGYMNDPGMVAAYRAFFAPLNAAKVALVIERLVDEGRIRLPPQPRVLDLGAGPLSATVGAAIALGGLGPSMAVDRSRAAMESGRDWLQRCVVDDGAHGVDVRLIVEDLRRYAPSSGDGPFDLVVVANAINEVGDPRRGLDARFQVIKRALSAVSSDGGVLIIEPATRVHTRSLQLLRDMFVNAGLCSVTAPCPQSTRTCPLNASSGDWCFSDFPWMPPPAFVALERAAGLRNPVLQTSYLLLSPRRAQGVNGARVIGGVMRAADGERRYLCTTGGRKTMFHPRELPASLRQAARGTWLPVVDENLFQDDRRAPGRDDRRPPRGRKPRR